MRNNFQEIKDKDDNIIGYLSRSINDRKYEVWETVKDKQGQKCNIQTGPRYDTFLEAKKAAGKLIARRSGDTE